MDYTIAGRILGFMVTPVCVGWAIAFLCQAFISTAGGE